MPFTYESVIFGEKTMSNNKSHGNGDYKMCLFPGEPRGIPGKA